MMYKDFMSAFAKAFSSYLGSTILEVEIGTGPSGELRYPSYPSNKWTFPGVGGFQSYSSYALDSLQEAATAIGHPEWALVAGPSNAGGYNSYPDDTTFFSEGKQSENNYQSAYGDFYLGWYASSLIEHGDAILGKAEAVFTGMSVSLSVKVAGIHWWYFHPSHAAELTAGYYNLDTYYSAQPVAEEEEGKVSSHLLISQPFARYAPSSLRGGSKKADGSYQGGSSYGYDGIASMIASHKGTTFLFTCLEMQDSEQSSSCDCGPYELVGQTKQSAINANVPYSGENALERYDETAYETIETQASRYGVNINRFTYLRLGSTLTDDSGNWNTFTNFVSNMNSMN